MKSIMIVDDSKIMRTIVKNTVELLKVPCRYFEAEDGNRALEILEANPVDLVLLDWNMPNLSGIDFLKKIRAMDKYRDIPVIMVTSEAARLNVVEAVKAGVTSYVTKPISDDVFMEKVGKYL
ncbi:MAG: response regulator [Treponema sp.]|jgi:two-component system chemotaxis response regulator CheY|nr:response regulator [Treponema sp.]